eukprot:3864425-Amphidinium_carterae.2
MCVNTYVTSGYSGQSSLPAIEPDLHPEAFYVRAIADNNRLFEVDLHVGRCETTIHLPVAIAEIPSKVAALGH